MRDWLGHNHNLFLIWQMFLLIYCVLSVEMQTKYTGNDLCSKEGYDYSDKELDPEDGGSFVSCSLFMKRMD